MNASEVIARMSTAANFASTKTITDDSHSFLDNVSPNTLYCICYSSIAINKIKKIAPASESTSSNQAWAFIPLHRVECRVEPPRRTVGGGTSRS
ncbi:hypothetical protein ACEPAI_2785 [Sanghuangporus weigelae]